MKNLKEYQKEKLRHLKIYQFKVKIHKQSKEWLIKNFSEGADEYPVNVSMLIRNIVWQQRTRILQEGKPLRELLRTFWYMYIKSTLSRAGGLSRKRDQYQDMIREIVELVKQWDLLRYRDIGFLDQNRMYRKVGENANVIVFSEKEGHHDFLLEMYEKYRISIIALGGQPSLVNLEYFVDDMKSKKVNLKRTFHLFSLVDFDTSGWILRDVFEDDLRHYGVKSIRLEDLVHPDMLTPEEILVSRYQISEENQQSVTKNDQWLAEIGEKNYQNQSYFEPEFVDGERVVYGLEAESISTVRMAKSLAEFIPPIIGNQEDLWHRIQLEKLKEILKELMFI